MIFRKFRIISEFFCSYGLWLKISPENIYTLGLNSWYLTSRRYNNVTKVTIFHFSAVFKKKSKSMQKFSELPICGGRFRGPNRKYTCSSLNDFKSSQKHTHVSPNLSEHKFTLVCFRKYQQNPYSGLLSWYVFSRKKYFTFIHFSQSGSCFAKCDIVLVFWI